MIMIEFDYKSAGCRRQTRIGAEKRPEHGSDRLLNMPRTLYKSTMNIHIILFSTFSHIYIMGFWGFEVKPGSADLIGMFNINVVNV